MLLSGQLLRPKAQLYPRCFTSDLWCCGLQLVTRAFHAGQYLRGHGGRWTQAEDECVVSMRRAGKTMKEIAEALPNRTLLGCAYRWKSRLLNANPELRKYGKKPAPKLSKKWTEAECTALLALWAQGKSMEKIQQQDFPNRTTRAIGHKLGFLAARGDNMERKRRNSSPVSAEDEDILRNMQTRQFTLRQIADALKRPESGLRKRLNHMGIKWRRERVGRSSKPWTEAELAVLNRFVKQNNPNQRMTLGYEDIKDLVPGRSYDAILYKVFVIRKRLEVVTPRTLRAWTPVEIEEVLRFMATLSPHTSEATIEKLAETLGRSRASVQDKIKLLRKRKKAESYLEGQLSRSST